jgi:hypothetical protein
LVRKYFLSKLFIFIYFFLVAIERKINEVNKVLGGVIFKVGNVQLYKRNRNKLNLIIIPISIAIVVFLTIITFVLRKLRFVKSFR